jgi:hypothetical protein
VRHVAVLWKAGETVQAILETYPHLQVSWVLDAVSYYFDHQRDIEQEIEANRIEDVLEKLGAVMDDSGVVRFPAMNVKDGMQDLFMHL